MKKTIKKLLLTCGLIAGSMTLFTACSKSDTSKEKETTVDTTNIEVDQLAAPQAGDTVAEITVKDFGVIKVRFFANVTPKAYENFITHAKDGYYDGLTFHRIIDDFMIQGGDPKGTGSGGESIWEEPFEDEFSKYLAPVRGALCMANSGSNTNGSQFFIVQTKKFDLQYSNKFKSWGLPDKLVSYYKENGGAAWLYKAHTVFGQVYEGMDIVDKIAKVAVDSTSKPNEDVIIETIEIKEYK